MQRWWGWGVLFAGARHSASTALGHAWPQTSRANSDEGPTLDRLLNTAASRLPPGTRA